MSSPPQTRPTTEMMLGAPSWPAKMGDPTIAGWLITASYGVAGWLCVHAMNAVSASPSEPRYSRRQLAWFWAIAAAAVLGLGINKQLDLQTLAIELGKSIVHMEGWTANRVALKLVLLGAVGASSLLALAWLHARGNRSGRAPQLAIGGLLLIALYAMVRALAFSSLSRLVGGYTAGGRFGWLLELSGVALVAGGAWLEARRHRTPE